jgi:hypothetical protein
MSVLHPKASGNRAELLKAKTFIKVTGMGIAFYDSVKLQDFITELCSLLHAVENEFLADVQAAQL